MKHRRILPLLLCLLASCVAETGGDPPDDVIELADEPTDEPIARSTAEESPAAATWCTSMTLMSAGGTSCSTATRLQKVADYICDRDYNGYSVNRVYSRNGCKPGYFGVVSYKCCR